MVSRDPFVGGTWPSLSEGGWVGGGGGRTYVVEASGIGTLASLTHRSEPGDAVCKWLTRVSIACRRATRSANNTTHDVMTMTCGMTSYTPRAAVAVWRHGLVVAEETLVLLVHQEQLLARSDQQNIISLNQWR